jgi:hypothetical protein
MSTAKYMYYSRILVKEQETISFVENVERQQNVLEQKSKVEGKKS